MAARNETPAETLPNGQIVWAYNAKGKPICNSPKRLGRGRCQQTVGLAFNGRCEDHGGTSLKGVEHPRFRNGKQSKYADVLTGKAREAFDRLLEDPHYYLLREDIALARVRLREQMGELGSIDPDCLKRLVSRAHGAEELLDGEYDENDLEEHLREIVELVLTVEQRVNSGKEVAATQENLRKLVDTENKRLIAEQEQIPAARAVFLFMSLRDSVRINVWALVRFLREKYPNVLKDPDCPNPLKAIQEDINRLMPASASRQESEEFTTING